jgi:hypothetical protein
LASCPQHIVLTLATILGGTQAINAVGPLMASGIMEPAQKASRTPAQKKLDSQLLLEIDRRRSDTTQRDLPPDETGVKVDQKGRALVDVRANVTSDLEKKIRALDGAIVSTSPQYRSIIAWLPLLKLEQLAEDSAVVAVVPAARAITHR